MKPTGTKLALLFAVPAVLALSACQKQEASEPAASESAALQEAEPAAKPGVFVGEGRMVLPVVAGRPAAVYFTVRNEGTAKVTLSSVFVTGAGKAEMHKTEGGSMSRVDSVEIAPGASVAFAPGGYHVMAFDLADTLKAGGTGELTLTFSDGDKLSMPLKIEAMGAGDAGHDMAGMHH